jgi:hypothetical protein
MTRDTCARANSGPVFSDMNATPQKCSPHTTRTLADKARGSTQHSHLCPAVPDGMPLMGMWCTISFSQAASKGSPTVQGQCMWQ